MADIEQLKSKWSSIEMAAPPGAPGGRKLRQANSLRKKLSSRYNRMLWLAAAGMVLIIFSGLKLGFPWWLTGLFVVYFIISGVLDYMLMKGVDNFRPAELTVMQAVKAVERMAAMRGWFQVILITLCVPLLLVMFLYLDDLKEPLIIEGASIGAVIGLIWGLIIDHRFRSDMKALKAFLGDDNQEDASDGME